MEVTAASPDVLKETRKLDRVIVHVRQLLTNTASRQLDFPRRPGGIDFMSRRIQPMAVRLDWRRVPGLGNDYTYSELNGTSVSIAHVFKLLQLFA